MDVAAVFSRGNRLAALVCGLIIVIGIGTNFVLNRLSASSDLIRVEQLRLAEFKTQLNQIPGLTDSMRLGEEVSGYNQGQVTAAQQLNSLQAGTINRDLQLDQSKLNAYFSAARREIKAISLHQFDEALRIRQTESTPAFDVLATNVEERNLLLSNEAGQFRRNSQSLRNATFLGAGLLILVVVVGFHQISAANAEKERVRHDREISGLRFAALVQNSTDVIVLTSRKGVVTLVNDACQLAWGVTPRECVGKHITSIFRAIDSRDLTKVMEESLASPVTDFESSIKIEIRSGEMHHYQVHIRNLLGNVHIGGMVLTFHDITEHAAVEEALTHEATHDRLTGLPNRSQVLVRLTEALTRAKVTNHVIGALFIDLDNFKTINDTLGHEMGDLLLVKVAKRIQQAIRPSDMAARLGGDEFVVILENAGGVEAGEMVAKRLAEQFARPFHLGSEDMLVTASIGIALSDENDVEPNDVLRKADAAMYRAKRQGKSGYVNFDPSMKMQASPSDGLETELLKAVGENGFELQYQPIVALPDQSLKEAEVFIRWHHPKLGIVPPQKFIPLLEEQGLLGAVGDWLLVEVCRQLRGWAELRPDMNDLTVCINASHQQFSRPDFVARVEAVLAEHQIKPSQIKFEITESDLLIDLELSRSVCQVLRGHGIKISIDDFGTAQRSMDYLNDFPANALKVDRAITDQLSEDSSADRIFRSIVEKAHALNIEVIGEGIETPAQLEVLMHLKCDLAQGFLFAKPMSSESLTQVLERKGEAGLMKVL